MKRKRELEAFDCKETLGAADIVCESADCPMAEDTWDDEGCIHEDEGPVVNDAKVGVVPKDLTSKVDKLRK